MEDGMRTVNIAKSLTVLAVAATFAGCSTWHKMDKTEGTVAGGAAGAVGGAVVAGPVGAVVGGVGGAYAGNEVAGKDRPASSTTYSATPAPGYDSALVRDVQAALNAKGYNAGPVDGQMGASTRDAIRRFQGASGLAQTGEPDRQTVAALGIRG
jgi:hypothetical protein